MYKSVKCKVTSAVHSRVRVLFLGNVKEEAEGVIGFVPAKMTFERIRPFFVIAHMNVVHCAILEKYPAKLTRV